MELGKGRTQTLQQRMNSLSLTTKDTGGAQVTDCVLLGKIISVRLFRKKDLVQIINNIWRTKDRVHVERLTDFLFKFCFSMKEDRDMIFER